MAVNSDDVRRGAIVLARLPGDEARPMAVVRSDLLADLSHATVLPITTELRDSLDFRITVEPTEENKLKSRSQIMADWPQTLRLNAIRL